MHLRPREPRACFCKAWNVNTNHGSSCKCCCTAFFQWMVCNYTDQTRFNSVESIDAVDPSRLELNNSARSASSFLVGKSHQLFQNDPSLISFPPDARGKARLDCTFLIQCRAGFGPSILDTHLQCLEKVRKITMKERNSFDNRLKRKQTRPEC